MSAMHWEARRRQHALDRRMARDKHKLLNRDSESICTATKSQQDSAAAGQCPHCRGDLRAAGLSGAKIPNRYSSLQYTQQW